MTSGHRQKSEDADERGNCQDSFSMYKLSDKVTNQLVVKAKIMKGEIISVDKAVITSTRNNDLDCKEIKILEQLRKLRSCDKKGFYSLPSMSICLPKTCKLELAIFLRNSILLEDGTFGLFLCLSKVKHSCDPNAFYVGVGDDPREIELRAARDIEEGEEVKMNYLLMENRFPSQKRRKEILLKTRGLRCNCHVCNRDKMDVNEQKQEILKEEIVSLQANMARECDQNPQSVSWLKLCSYQSEIVDLVGQLVMGDILLVRELWSLVHLSQLAREENILKGTLGNIENLINGIGGQKWKHEFAELIESLEKWKKKRLKIENPSEDEIREFLWLM